MSSFSLRQASRLAYRALSFMTSALKVKNVYFSAHNMMTSNQTQLIPIIPWYFPPLPPFKGAHTNIFKEAKRRWRFSSQWGGEASTATDCISKGQYYRNFFTVHTFLTGVIAILRQCGDRCPQEVAIAKKQ